LRFSPVRCGIGLAGARAAERTTAATPGSGRGGVTAAAGRGSAMSAI